MTVAPLEAVAGIGLETEGSVVILFAGAFIQRPLVCLHWESIFRSSLVLELYQVFLVVRRGYPNSDGRNSDDISVMIGMLPLSMSVTTRGRYGDSYGHVECSR